MNTIDKTNTAIAVGISCLLSYGFYSFNMSSNRVLVSVGAMLFFISTLVLLIGIDFERPRTKANVRVLSSLFFVIALVSAIVFSTMEFSVATYVILNGIIGLLFVLMAKSIIEQRQ